MQRAHAVASSHALLALLMAGCHHVVHHPGEEYLATIRFEGNHAIPDRALTTGLALHRAQQQGGAPDPYLVTVDRERVRGQYLRDGYFDVDVRSRVERRGDAATVIYTISEGPRARTRVVITGLPASDPDLRLAKVRAALPLANDQPFTYEPYDKAKDALLAIAQDAGYAHATLDAQVIVDRADHAAVVQLDYTLGPKCRFGKVEVVGAPPDLAGAVRARLAFREGDQFSTAAIAASQRAIYGMRRFSTVRVLPDRTNGEEIDVRVTLAESARHELGLGGGFGMDPATYEVRGRINYAITGWPLPLYDALVDLRPAYALIRTGGGNEPRVRAMAKLRRLDLFLPYVIGEIEGGYNFLTVETYTSYGPRARLGVESPVGFQQLKLRVGWSFERLDFRQISPLIDPTLEHELGLDQPERIGKYEQTLALDLRDNIVEPRFGTYAEVRVAEGTPYAGGAFAYTQITPEIRGYLPIGPTVLAARARAGAFFGDIPVTERYYSGGSTTQRGFSERRLAPTLNGVVDGHSLSLPIGGGALVESNLELRAELAKIRNMGLGAAVFLDGGDVTERYTDIDLGHLHWAVGAGARLLTPVGALRIDFGYRLNRTGPTEPEPGHHWAFHLTLGEAY